MAKQVLHDRVHAAAQHCRSSPQPGKIRIIPCHDVANVSRPSVCCANRNPNQNHTFQSENDQHHLHSIATQNVYYSIKTLHGQCNQSAGQDVLVVSEDYRGSNDCVLVRSMWTQYAAHDACACSKLHHLRGLSTWALTYLRA